MASKKSPTSSESVREYVAERRTRDREFGKQHDEEFGKLQLARRIRALREAHDLSQGQLASAIGTTQSAIARLESGRFAPRLDVLQRVARALGQRLAVKFVPEGR